MAMDSLSIILCTVSTTLLATAFVFLQSRPDQQAESVPDIKAEFLIHTMAPQFDPNHHHHDRYLKYLDSALSDERNRNIALSGPYGSGKSSILDGLKKHSKFKEHLFFISLLTFSTQEYESSDNEAQSTGQQPAGAPKAKTNKQADARKRKTKKQTRKLQKAIVKQFLFATPASKLRNSKFSITHKTSARFALAQAITVAGVATVLLSLIPVAIPSKSAKSPVLSYLLFSADSKFDTQFLHILLLTFIVLTLLFWLFFYYLCPPLRFTAVKAKSVSLGMEHSRTNYFDKYVDEIIYFFENHPRCTIVVFEDLDRCDNAEIFYNLRELNTIINSNPDIRRKPIRFVYAVKDSLFDRDDIDRAATCNNTGTGSPAFQPGIGRAKFFDAIIPVVPFSSSLDASTLLSETFKKEMQ